MKKVCFVLPCNLYVLPFYYKYEALALECKCNVDLIYWNRDLINENHNKAVRAIPFEKKAIYNKESISTMLSFLSFTKFVKKQIKINQYDKIIFLGTYACTVSLLAFYLKRNFKNRYWIDIRDYTYEWFKPYKKLLKLSIDNAAVVAISSDGYKKFLPDYNYLRVHNIDLKSISSYNELKQEPPGQSGKINLPIRVSFIGNVRYYPINKRLLEMFKNNPNFILQYYGQGSHILEQYCKENGIVNVDFHGRFDHEATSEFYNRTDIINNVYGNSGIELTTALSNKLYFATALHKPILISNNTYMEKIAGEYGFGYAVDLDCPDTPDRLLEWYKRICKDADNQKYDQFMELVIQDENKFKENFHSFCLS